MTATGKNGKGAFLGIKPKICLSGIIIWSMTGKAAVRQNGLDVEIEINALREIFVC